MQALTVFTLALIASLILSGFYEPGGAAHIGSEGQARQKAEQLWERSIAAKGGRERLHNINNFVVSSRTRYKRDLLGSDTASGLTEESLYALPDRWWSFWDYRPGKLGHGVTVADFERGIRWKVSPGRPVRFSPRPEIEKDILDGLKWEFRKAQFTYLMETRWLKPIFRNARTGFINLKRVDVVETIIDGARVDFFLDWKTHLPVRIATGTTPGDRADGRMNHVINLSDYTEVDGIQMPQRVAAGGADNQTSYQFNVDYGESIFEHPPTSEIEPDAWKEPSK